MSGRIEQDRKREEWIEKRLIDSPQIVRDYMLSIKRKASSTRKAYLSYITQYITFMSLNGLYPENVKPMHIDRYIDYISKESSASIINVKLSAIKDFYDYLLKNGLVQKNPCLNDMKLKVEPKETVVYLTDPEIEKIKTNVSSGKIKYRNRDLCIITLGCATGLRVSAIANIDIEDIDFNAGTISVVEKGNKKRVVYIGANTTKAIQKWMKDREGICGNNTGALFISQKHNRISTRAIQKMISNASKGIDKHITPHKMRSTCAMKLYDKTGDIYLTAQQLGHSNIKNTMIYAQATEDKRREAAMLLD